MIPSLRRHLAFLRHPGHRPGIQGAVVVTPAVGVNRYGKKERIATGAYLQQARWYAHYVVIAFFTGFPPARERRKGLRTPLKIPSSRAQTQDPWSGGIGRASLERGEVHPCAVTGE